MSEILEYESSGDVAVLRLDDGKANAISPTVLEALQPEVRFDADDGKAGLKRLNRWC